MYVEKRLNELKRRLDHLIKQKDELEIEQGIISTRLSYATAETRETIAADLERVISLKGAGEQEYDQLKTLYNDIIEQMRIGSIVFRCFVGLSLVGLLFCWLFVPQGSSLVLNRYLPLLGGMLWFCNHGLILMHHLTADPHKRWQDFLRHHHFPVLGMAVGVCLVFLSLRSPFAREIMLVLFSAYLVALSKELYDRLQK